MHFVKSLALAVLALPLVSCDAIDTLKEGLTHAEHVAADLKQSIGLETQVGFNQNNGTLTQVTVMFVGLPEQLPLREIATRAKAAVTARFQQTPQQIVISFSVAATES
jgi:hypothetical protein